MIGIYLGVTIYTLVSLLLVSKKVIFKIHDLVGINFSDFIISSSDTYQILSEFPTVSSNDEPSRKVDLLIFKTGCPKATVAS